MWQVLMRGCAMKGIGKNKIIKMSLIVVLIFMATYFAGYFFSRNSEAFSVTKDFILKSEIVKNELGSIGSIHLSPFGYELEFSGSHGSAEFECDLVGVAKAGKAYVQLKKQSYLWNVVSAKLIVDGREVDFR